MGRHSTFSTKTIDAICERLQEGEPLAVICRDDDMPGVMTVWDWQQKHPEITVVIAHAREIGFDTIARNARRVAQGVEGHSSGDVQRDKLIVDTDLKLLAKWDPKRYGDKTTTELTGPDGKDLSLTDHEAAAKLAAILEAVRQREGKS